MDGQADTAGVLRFARTSHACVRSFRSADRCYRREIHRGPIERRIIRRDASHLRRDIQSESIVFHDQRTTALAAIGAVLRRVTSDDDTKRHIAERQGGPEWLLELQGEVVGKGGILFHYNRPYGDIYMEVSESFRQRGLGSYLVQELKRAAYELGAIPCAVQYRKHRIAPNPSEGWICFVFTHTYGQYRAPVALHLRHGP